MPRVNPTEFAILGLLADESRSGYDIKKEVETRLGHFWSESYGHIYPMLRRLHERDLVAKELQRQEGRPDRHVYSITEDGRRALEDWFAEPPAAGRPRNELLLRIFLGRHGKREYLLRDVRQFRERAEGTLAQLRAVAGRIENEPPHPDAAFWKIVIDFGLKAFAALAEWSREADVALERLGCEAADSVAPETRAGRGHDRGS